VGRIKGLLSRNIYSIGELDNSSTEKRAKGNSPETNTTDKKEELHTFAPGDACRWEMLKMNAIMMSENPLSQS
jgi:hypothetical protein